MRKKGGYSCRKLFLSLGLCVFLLDLFGGVRVFAQDQQDQQEVLTAAASRNDFWVCPVAEVIMYSVSSTAYGGGLALGYGNGASIGFKAAYLVDADGQVTTLELNFLFRWYFLGSGSGPYLQINGGPAFFAQYESMAIPSEIGTVSAGLSVGWRFLLGRYWFIEPGIRGGYPYIAGAGLSAGFRF